MKKTGFTLIEMLIVVVIIGILVSALLPRVQGYMAKTRDLKRQADLRNIAAAIEMYRNEYGEFPLPYHANGNQVSDHYDNHAGIASEFSLPLEDYLLFFPTDPNKKNLVTIHTHHQKQDFIKRRIKPGEYVYQFGRKGKKKYGILAFVAKVETPESANYVLTEERKRRIYCEGCGWTSFYGGDTPSTPPDLEKLELCNTVKKVNKGEEKFATQTNKECKYSSEDQLYYIVKIE